MSNINQFYPGAFEGPMVKYTSVIGKAIKGESRPSSSSSEGKGISSSSSSGGPPPSFSVLSLLAFTSYYTLSGEGEAYGDGDIL